MVDAFTLHHPMHRASHCRCWPGWLISRHSNREGSSPSGRPPSSTVKPKLLTCVHVALAILKKLRVLMDGSKETNCERLRTRQRTSRRLSRPAEATRLHLS